MDISTASVSSSDISLSLNELQPLLHVLNTAKNVTMEDVEESSSERKRATTHLNTLKLSFIQNYSKEQLLEMLKTTSMEELVAENMKEEEDGDKENIHTSSHEQNKIMSLTIQSLSQIKETIQAHRFSISTQRYERDEHIDTIYAITRKIIEKWNATEQIADRVTEREKVLKEDRQFIEGLFPNAFLDGLSTDKIQEQRDEIQSRRSEIENARIQHNENMQKIMENCERLKTEIQSIQEKNAKIQSLLNHPAKITL